MKKQIPALGIACIARRYRSAIKEIERIGVRAAIQCLRIACTHRGEGKRRRTILFEVQRIVVRRIAIDRDTRMDVGGTACRRRFRGILETVAVECEDGSRHSTRTRHIRLLAKFVVACGTDKGRSIVGQCETCPRVERECRNVDSMSR